MRKFWIILISAILVILLIIFILMSKGKKGNPVFPLSPQTQAVKSVDDSAFVLPPDKKEYPKENRSMAPVSSEDSGIVASPVPVAPADTVPPYVFADPAAGLYGEKVSISLIADEPCSIYYKTETMPGWANWTDPVLLMKNERIEFYAIDMSGNVSEKKSALYELEGKKRKACTAGMVFVSNGSIGFCMDEYEWPNRKGTLPLSMVSFYAAKDSCMSLGKRLCSFQEWSLACAGIHGNTFAYGSRYQGRACNTQDTIPHLSGMSAECRSYNGIFDMNGNLREWTDTKAAENKRFYKVAGGFWESHSNSSCTEYQFSFYPQNTHVSVGFRCCQESSP